MSRVRKICPICAFWRDGYCSIRREIIPSNVRVSRCEMFELKAMPKKTIFQQITASPEVLAPKFVHHVTSFLDGLDKPKKIWYSTLINNQYFNTELEAKRATVAKLNEVCDEHAKRSKVNE